MSNVHQNETQTFMLALPNNRVLSLGFNYKGHQYRGIHCPCSKIMGGWRTSNRILSMPMFMGDSDCNSKAYTPESIINHLTIHLRTSSFHYGALRYPQILFCDKKLKLRPCQFPVADPTSSPSTAITISELNSTVNLLNISNDNNILSPSKTKISILEHLKESLTCPITLCVIKDPAIASDGLTYKQCAIQRWMLSNPHSSGLKIMRICVKIFPPGHLFR